jgi:hypothetical protein
VTPFLLQASQHQVSLPVPLITQLHPCGSLHRGACIQMPTMGHLLLHLCHLFQEILLSKCIPVASLMSQEMQLLGSKECHSQAPQQGINQDLQIHALTQIRFLGLSQQ